MQRNMHKSVKARRITGQGKNVQEKVVVMGMLERGGKVRAQVVPDRKQETLQPIVKEYVQAGAAVFNDELWGYHGLASEYQHQIIDHAVKYVDGKIHTNGMENFWSLLKRGLGGTYVSVEPFHLFRYLDEQVFRYDNRGTKDKPVHDGQRFDMALRNVIGRRVMYKELTGKVGVSEPF